MATSTPTNHRVIVTLKLPVKATGMAAYAQQIVTCMTGNHSFPAPTPTLATITAAINDFQIAEAAALARAKGAAATRNVKRTALVQQLEQLKTYVQTIADATVEDATAIVQGAGMAVRKTPVHVARVFAAKQGLVSGSVKVVAPSAGHRASYNWQSSTDGGKTWVNLPGTLQAKTTVSGLAAGSTITFRYQPLVKTGEGDWSQPVQFLVK